MRSRTEWKRVLTEIGRRGKHKRVVLMTGKRSKTDIEVGTIKRWEEPLLRTEVVRNS